MSLHVASLHLPACPFPEAPTSLASLLLSNFFIYTSSCSSCFCLDLSHSAVLLPTLLRSVIQFCSELVCPSCCVRVHPAHPPSSVSLFLKLVKLFTFSLSYCVCVLCMLLGHASLEAGSQLGSTLSVVLLTHQPSACPSTQNTFVELHTRVCLSVLTLFFPPDSSCFTLWGSQIPVLELSLSYFSTAPWMSSQSFLHPSVLLRPRPHSFTSIRATGSSIPLSCQVSP